MFESLLAKRYIITQKRHSAITVCSIAIALALITLLFSVFSTVLTCLRSFAYYQEAYHIKISSTTGYYLSEEQYNAIADAVSEYGTCTPEKIFMSTNKFEEYRYRANILLDKNIDSAELFVHNVIREKTGIEGLSYYTNDLLIFCDMIDAHSRLYMAGIIALFYVFVLFLIMMLRLIIDTAFEISSKERERQFGVLQSVGATPKQIVRIITYEGLMLSVIGIPLGVGVGIGLGYLVYRAVLGTGLVDLYLSQSVAAELVHFSANPWLLLLGVITGAAWVLFSAYGTGMRVIKMSPVQAISQRSNTVQKVGKFSLFGKLFGWTGKIASRNNMRQPKRFIATIVSLTLSISLFSAVTVAINNLQGAAEKYFAGLNHYGSDFEILYDIDHFNENQFYYRRLVDLLEESGLFDDMIYTHSEWGSLTDNEEYIYSTPAFVDYFSRAAYNHLFGGNPPVSYDELTESGGYLLDGQAAASVDSTESITMRFREKTIVIYEEEYNALPPEEQEKYIELWSSSDGGVTKDFRYEYTPMFTVDFDVYHVNNPITNEYGDVCQLIGTIDQYENGEYKLFENRDHYYGMGAIDFKLINDGDYYKALDFFEQNSIHAQDYTAENRQFRALLSSINIIATFFSVMIALIAVVNMVNILSTGILNRRGELAAMQCVGMTEKQLYRMTAVECFQYALLSGIAAVAVCELLMFFTDKLIHIAVEFAEELGQFISYVQPLPIIGTASLCAFVVAIVTSVTSLRTMRSTSLVEQIRSVE